MSMTVGGAKAILNAVIERTIKSIERLPSYEKELANDKATLAYINNLQDNGDPLPGGSPYDSFTDWKEFIEKQIRAGENSLDRVSVEKAELMAFEYFVETAPEA
ncbi:MULTISPECIES: protein-tyrosine phosphatase family protein [Cetobacterium]|jgi:hypothetical protein|uniref:Uncharacterized protein n=1 Tax=Candidatus Cetobacterium colombiensis TaxID=3073100 RepID=A0ABU4WCT5_9FUSO|nr:hypothetical protein [Candidatus Cetobacterium colombiensis]MDX8337337.1 hypothetical protein [Candidatus Cetobacterium colombiensis]